MKRVKQGQTRWEAVMYEPGCVQGYDDVAVAMVYACRVTQVGNCGNRISYTGGNGPYIAGRGWWMKNTHATYRKAMADARRQIAEWERAAIATAEGQEGGAL